MLRTTVDHGRYFAVDIGGTNLRVGLIELVGPSQLHRHHEKNWPIPETKKQSATDLFNWIGSCIATVVHESFRESNLNGISPSALIKSSMPVGVTFSFPVEQQTLRDAKITALGKGFIVERGADLPALLVAGYNNARSHLDIPRIDIAAIANDSVSTLVSFVYEFDAAPYQKAVMGLICGTGTNATLPMKVGMLGEKTKHLDLGTNGDDIEAMKVVVNTEWSINGSAPPLSSLNLITRWDTELSESIEFPGFQPLEYMTSGRYLGELCRLALLEYMTLKLGIDQSTIPRKLVETKHHPQMTTFLSPFRPPASRLIELLNAEFPPDHTSFTWTDETALAFHHIAKAVQVRAAGIIAAAIIGLLDSAGEIQDAASFNQQEPPFELVVGYTGGCIANFQDYLADCQKFLDLIMEENGVRNMKVRLWPCHDGGIKGAGILVPAAIAAGV